MFGAVYLDSAVVTLLVQFVWPVETMTFESEWLQITGISKKVCCEEDMEEFVRRDRVNRGQKFM